VLTTTDETSCCIQHTL